MLEANMKTSIKIMVALLDNKTITAIGGMVYDSQMEYLCGTTELHELVTELRKNTDYRIARIDSGGKPTWKLICLRQA